MLTTVRKHITQDIRPYNCLHEACQFYNMPFDNRMKWESHMDREHRQLRLLISTTCPLCQKQGTAETMARLHHLSKHLEYIALSALPLGVESDASSALSDIPSESEARTIVLDQLRSPGTAQLEPGVADSMRREAAMDDALFRPNLWRIRPRVIGRPRNEENYLKVASRTSVRKRKRETKESN